MTNNNSGSQQSDAVLVVGAGIGGMQSALLLAEAGRKVFLLDSAPGIGGSMHLLDLTFPTDSCGLCLMLPGRAAHCPTIECDLHRNIEILPYSEVVGVEGEPGSFTVTVRHKPRYVRVDRRLRHLLPGWAEGMAGYDLAWRESVVRELVGIASQVGISLACCAECAALADRVQGVGQARCGDYDWFAALSGRTPDRIPFRGSRPGCGCTRYFDVGSYGHWSRCHRCAYCYAG